MDLNKTSWINPLSDCTLTVNALTVTTDPETVLRQRSFYGFRDNNALTFLRSSQENQFTFSVRIR